jgi:nucleoside phosphorylase
MTTHQRVLNFEDYTVAWIAVLPIEAEAALAALDVRHDGYFESELGDDYIYVGGEINKHNVVIATLPAGQNYGTASAAALANQVKARFSNLRFALLVGVAAGLPNLFPKPPAEVRDIRLGDVLVCVPEKSSAGIVYYDLGQDTENGFVLNNRQTEAPAIVRSAVSNIRLTEKRPFKTGNTFSTYLEQLQAKAGSNKFQRPKKEDELYQSAENDLIASKLLSRANRDSTERTQVWYGKIGSGNSLIKNPKRRNELRDTYDLIGLEMEAAGVINTLPTGVVRGVSDYGDSYKDKEWQPYAAAVAAVYAKGILYSIHYKALQRS